MKIAIITAMQKELSLLLPLLEDRKNIEIEGRSYYRGRMSGHEIIAGQCGIGKVNSALNTLRLIRAEKPDMVINSGVAGGGAPAVFPLDVIIASDVAYHDVWCGPGTVYGEADGFPLKMKPDEVFINACKGLMKDKHTVKTGLICSGDKFIDSVEQINEIRGRFPDVLAVDMESASIAQTCISENTPFGIIRVISDSPLSGNNFEEYQNFWDKAPEATFHALLSILASLD